MMFLFFFKQKTAYEMRISDWSSDVCSSDLTTYTIAFGDKRSEAVVELKKEDIYSKFIDKLWRAVCVRLLGEMLEALKDGRDLYFGDALLHDDGITLVKHKFLGANERVRCTWGQVQIWNADGRSEGHKSELQSLMRIS